MLVSVIVPVYNGEHTIRACLDALLAQDFQRGEYEVIIVDNGSTDSTWAIIQGYGTPVRGLQETEVRGSYAARNAGIRSSQGRVLAFTDADCIADRNWLELLVSGFDDAETGCVGGEVIALEPTTPAEKYQQRIGVLRQKNTLTSRYRAYFQTANVAYRRDVFDEIGLFDPSLESGGDADISWRMLAETSWKMHFQMDATVLHHHRTNSKELWRQYKRYGRGRADLQVSYPDFACSPYQSFDESFHRFARLVKHGARYLPSPLFHGSQRQDRRESLEHAFYSFITQGAFVLGVRERGGKTPLRAREALGKHSTYSEGLYGEPAVQKGQREGCT